MRASRHRIAEVIARRIDNGASLSKLSKEIAAYLLSEDRLSELESIMRDVIAIRAESGNVEAYASSAHSLADSVKKDIEQLIKTIRPNAKQILINEKLDSNLLGGLKLSIVNQSLDVSVRAKLSRLKQLTSQGGF